MSDENPITYRFLLKDLKTCNDEDLTYIIELMRVAEHVKAFMKLFQLHLAIAQEESDEDIFFAQMDSSHILMLNMMGAQLREAVKVFWKFSEKPLHKRLKESLSEEQNKTVDYLEQILKDFNEKKGILYTVLKPHRDKVFHYDPEQVKPWLNEIKESENDRKPFIQSVSPDALDFYVGAEYDSYIYSRSFFINPDDIPPEQQGKPNIFEGQNEVFQIQHALLHYVEYLTRFILKENNIEPGRFGMPIHRFPRAEDFKE